MKKIRIITLAVILALSAFVVCAYGESLNSVNKTRVVKDKAEITDVYLKIVPKNEVTTGDSIILTYKNAEVLELPQFGNLQGGGMSWNDMDNLLHSKGAKEALNTLWDKTSDSYLPWNLKKMSNHAVEVELFPLPGEYSGRNIGVHNKEPFYYIPLSVKAVADKGDEIQVSIDSNGTTITGNKPTFGTMPLEATTKTETTTKNVAEKESEETTEAEAVTKAKEEKGSLEIRVSIGSTSARVGSTVYELDVAPYIQPESSSTLVPLRFVAIAALGEAVGELDNSDIVSWDADTKTASIKTSEGKTVSFTAGSGSMVIDGESITMDNGVKAEIKNGRMFIPFRALGSALGVKVGWEAETKTALFIS